MNTGPNPNLRRNRGTVASTALREIARHATLLLVCAAMGRAALPDGSAPFAPAVCAAAFIAGLPASAIIGCFMGVMLRFQWSVISAMAIFVAGAWAFKQLFGKVYKQHALACLFVGLALAWLLFDHSTKYALLTGALGVIASILLAFLYSNAFQLIQSLRIRKLLSEEEIISLSVVAGTGLLGIADVEFYGILPACIFAGVITILIGVMGGAGPGAAAGLAMGAMLAVGGRQEYLTLLGLMGITAGALRQTGRIGGAIGSVLAAAVLVFYGRENIMLLINSTLAALIFVFLPNNFCQFVGKFVNASLHRESNRKEYLQRLRSMTRDQLYEFGYAFSQMGEVFTQPLPMESNPKWPVQALRCVCRGCAAENRCWSDEKKLRAELDQINTTGVVPFRLQRCKKLEELSNMSQALQDSFLREKKYRDRAELQSTMAGRQLEGLSDVIFEMADKLDRNVSYDDVVEAKLLRMLDKERISAKDAIVQYAGGRVTVTVEGRTCLNTQRDKLLQIVSKVCGRTMRLANHECMESCYVYFEQSRTYEIAAGIAQCAKDGAQAIGDSVFSDGMQNGRYLVAISDGMGSGERAMKESETTIALLQRLYAAGIDRRSIMEAVNRLLLLRSADEMYSTVDSCFIDLISGKAELCKLGAAPSFWINDEGVTEFRSESLPVGILDEAKADVFRFDLRENDWLVMMSDGVSDALGQSIKQAVSRHATGKPEEAALRLMELAKLNGANDDLTVVAFRVNNGVRI